MPFDSIKNDLDSQKRGSLSTVEIERIAEQRGINSQPLKSDSVPDIRELIIINICQGLHTETLSCYANDEIDVRSKVHPYLIKTKFDSSEQSDWISDIPQEDSSIIFSAIMNNNRYDLDETGRKALNEQNDLIQFKKENKLDREAEYPDNQRKIFLIIGGVISVIGVSTLGLLASQDSDFSTLGVFGATLLILLINSILGIISAEVFRAWNHCRESLRITSKILLFILVTLVIIFNLGIGHYRDAMDPNYPPISTSEASDPNNSETQSESTQIVSDNENIATSEHRSSQEAADLLFSKFIVMNDFFSYILVILGIILFGAITWLMWKNDDEYLLYGRKTRQFKRHMKDWYTVQKNILSNLQTERDQITNRLKESQIDFVKERNSVLTIYKNSLITATNLIDDIRATCVISIRIYRTANRAVRPKLTPPPPQWDGGCPKIS